MSETTQNTKVSPSNLPIPAKTKSVIKTYVEHGYIKVNGDHVEPKNENEAYRLINPKCNRKHFKQYIQHVQTDLRK